MQAEGMEGVVAAHERNASSYLLEHDGLLSAVDYKLLSGLKSSHLLECCRSRLNGQLKLTYFSDGCDSLAGYLPQITSEQLMVAFESALEGVLEVEEHGFLNSAKLDLSPEAIRVEPTTCDVHLVYLPISFDEDGSDEVAVFSRICQVFMWAMSQSTRLRPQMRTVAGMINASGGRVDVLLQALRGTFTADVDPIRTTSFGEDRPLEPDSALFPPSGPVGGAKRIRPWRLVGDAAGVPLEIRVFPGSLVLGKSSSSGFRITGVPTVSNRHCQLDLDETGLVVSDLNSTNGTTVNGRRLAPGSAVRLQPGDILGISSVRLTVRGVE